MQAPFLYDGGHGDRPLAFVGITLMFHKMPGICDEVRAC